MHSCVALPFCIIDCSWTNETSKLTAYYEFKRGIIISAQTTACPLFLFSTFCNYNKIVIKRSIISHLAWKPPTIVLVCVHTCVHYIIRYGKSGSDSNINYTLRDTWANNVGGPVALMASDRQTIKRIINNAVYNSTHWKMYQNCSRSIRKWKTGKKNESILLPIRNVKLKYESPARFKYTILTWP